MKEAMKLFEGSWKLEGLYSLKAHAVCPDKVVERTPEVVDEFQISALVYFGQILCIERENTSYLMY